MGSDTGVEKVYDVIVVGCGGIGSAALYWLSKRNIKVLGLEQFCLGHDNGGSQDHSRIIRLMYHEEKYIRLAKPAYQAWEEVEKDAGLQLVYKTGGLVFSHLNTPEEKIGQLYMKSMDKEKIPYEKLDGTGIKNRFPQFNTGSDIIGLFQPDSGIVDAALANSVHVQLAQGNGAEVVQNVAVTRIIRDQNGILKVHTTKQVFLARKIVVAAGAWLNEVLGSIGVHIPVTVTQEQVTYYATPHVKDFTKERFPVWLYQTPTCDIYGLPSHVNSYSKIGIDAGGPAVTASTRSYTPDPKREAACEDILKQLIPKALGPIAYTKTCLYTMPPDRNFVIDDLSSKGWPEVIVCCGAGHAFKFACILGKILSELALDGKTSLPIEEFTIERDAITDPNYKPSFYMGQAQVAKVDCP